MTFTARDLGKLQWPLLGALLLMLLAALPAWWSSQEVAQARQERDQAASRQQRTEQRLLQVRTEEQELRERAEVFQQMQQAGITGDERRLEWTELLDEIQRELRIPGINYEFGVRKPLDNGGSHQYGYFASPMRIQLRLLHEEDLLRFLDRLQREAKALVVIRGCTLTPRAEPAVGTEDLPGLAAECDLRWITLRKSAAAS